MPRPHQVEVLHAPPRGEAIQRDHPAVCRRYSAHEWLGELDRGSVDDAFDLVQIYEQIRMQMQMKLRVG